MKIFKYLIYMVLFMFLGLLGFAGGAFIWVRDMSSPVSGTPSAETFVPPGSNTRQIASLLKQNNIIRSAFLFSFYIRFLAVDQRLRPGAYRFSGDETLSAVVHKLLHGTLKSVPVTIPEGLTINQIAEILQNSGICNANEFIEAISDPALLSRIFAEWELIPPPEGLAFPDTYHFERPTKADRVAERMLRLTRHRIDRIFSDELPRGLTQYEACILASVIEKEAALPNERDLIASVFYNRLSRNIKLESCATVLYALGKHQGRLLYKDLKIDSPYNTYKNSGLPPTPISNFGSASMKAVANPADTDYLFFVSDGAKGHRFSRTLNEHNRYRNQFFNERKQQQKAN